MTTARPSTPSTRAQDAQARKHAELGAGRKHRHFAAVIDAFGYSELATVLGKPAATVSSWKRRGRLPAEYWPAVVAEARRRKLSGITFEALASIAADRPRRRRRQGSLSGAAA